MRKIVVLSLPLLLISLFFGIQYYKIINPVEPLNFPTIQTQDLSSVKKLITEINARSQTLNSFVCSDIDVTSSDMNLIKLKAVLAYEKPGNVRMVISSIFGKEADIGSNDTYFWFWSKRMKPSALYYATHEKIYQTRLKTPFNPIWIKQTLGFEEIKIDKAYVSQDGNLYYLYIADKNTLGNPVIRVLVLDAEKKCMIAQHIFENSRLVCSSQINEFVIYNGMYLPKSIVSTWYEENIKTTWTMNNSSVNVKFQDKTWTMPEDHLLRINMADD